MKKLISSQVLAFTLATLPAAAGCSWFSHAATVAKADAIECAKQDLGQTVAGGVESLLLTVVTIVFNGGANWQADLDALAAKFGPETLACCAKVAQDLFSTGSGSPSTGLDLDTPAQRAAKALGKYAAGRKVQ